MAYVVIGLYGSNLDAGKGVKRWDRWRPSLSLLQHPDFIVDRFELLVGAKYRRQAQQLMSDMRVLAPETEVRLHDVDMEDPWDFEEVFSELHRFCSNYAFDEEREQYLVHITTGTHVAQICLFLLTEARFFPGRLIQSSPRRKEKGDVSGSYQIIDLDLSRYDAIATRFQQEKQDRHAFLKSGIETRNADFNHMIDEIELVAMRSRAPILIMGPTGAGKSRLAKRLFELKKARHQVTGEFVEINCSTIRGEGAMSALFGHTRGAFTGAQGERSGLLRKANKGVLFLDEVGELGVDEQAMLLRALEEKSFFPLGSDREVESDFQLLAGTNRDLWERVAMGAFRDDLLARINTWSFELPSLKDRPEDIAPNLQYELLQFANQTGNNVTFNKEAKRQFLDFALSADAHWTGNFRDLNGAVQRMATLAPAGRITEAVVEAEIGRLKRQWRGADEDDDILVRFMSQEQLHELDRFDRVQLAEVVRICRQTRTLSEAGRKLFAASRRRKASHNDADRLRKYLIKFSLDPQTLFSS